MSADGLQWLADKCDNFIFLLGSIFCYLFSCKEYEYMYEIRIMFNLYKMLRGVMLKPRKFKCIETKS